MDDAVFDLVETSKAKDGKHRLELSFTNLRHTYSINLALTLTKAEQKVIGDRSELSSIRQLRQRRVCGAPNEVILRACFYSYSAKFFALVWWQ